MKTLILLSLFSLPLMACAEDVIVGFDPLAKGNVRVDASCVRSERPGPFRIDKYVEVKVSPIGAPSGPVRVDFVFYKLFSNKTEPTPRLQVSVELPAGAGKCEFTEFFGRDPKEFVGWATRIVKDGTIIGIDGSSPHFEKLAADPATKMRYGNYLKTLATK